MTCADQLKVVLADTVTFSFQALGCHWNVEGVDFHQYHALFGEIYADVHGAIDPLAENIRKLGEYAPFNISRYSTIGTINFTDTSTDAQSMAAYLLAANDAVIMSVNNCFRAATADNEQGIADFLASRDDMHKKWRWQLRSSMK